LQNRSEEKTKPRKSHQVTALSRPVSVGTEQLPLVLLPQLHPHGSSPLNEVTLLGADAPGLGSVCCGRGRRHLSSVTKFQPCKKEPPKVMGETSHKLGKSTKTSVHGGGQLNQVYFSFVSNHVVKYGSLNIILCYMKFDMSCQTDRDDRAHAKKQTSIVF
jgi:hypothetical protein